MEKLQGSAILIAKRLGNAVESSEFETRDYGGQGSIKYVHPLTLSEMTQSSEYQKAIEYIKALARIRTLLTTAIKSVPLTNRGTMIKALQFDTKKYNFEFPVLTLVASASAENKDVSELASRFSVTSQKLNKTLSCFSESNRKIAVASLLKYLPEA